MPWFMPSAGPSPRPHHPISQLLGWRVCPRCAAHLGLRCAGRWRSHRASTKLSCGATKEGTCSCSNTRPRYRNSGLSFKHLRAEPGLAEPHQKRSAPVGLMASSSCVCRKTRQQLHRARAPSSGVATGSASLLRRQVLKDQGILGCYEIAERHLVKPKLPEECEHPVVVNLRSAWQVNLLDFPAARLANRLADLPN